MRVYEKISRLCRLHGAVETGITTALPFEGLSERLSDKRLNGFCEKDIRKRLDPRLTMENAKSIICTLFPYRERPDDVSDGFNAEKPQGKIASGDVWLGEDYHVYVKSSLNVICGLLKESLGGEYMPFCDVGPLADTALALRSGLCKRGRNGLAVNGVLGTYFYIGYILADIDIENARMDATAALAACCSKCRRCIDACPTGALSVDRTPDYAKCISYISQKKGELAPYEAQSLGNTLYGCMLCQSVCPANKKAGFVKYVNLEDNLNLSNSEFKRKFGNTAAGFIGRNIFLRNALIALENHGRRG